MVYRVSFDEGYSMRYILLCISFLLANSISGFAQSGLVWKKQLHLSQVLSVTGTDWGYGVSVANDTVKIWSMKDGNVVREVFRKGVFAATVDSTLQHIVYADGREYGSNGSMVVLHLDSNRIVRTTYLKDLYENYRSYHYSHVIGRTGLPLVVAASVIVEQGVSRWEYGKIISGNYSPEWKNLLEITDIKIAQPIRVRVSDNNNYIYGRFDLLEHIYNSSLNTYSYKQSSMLETYSLPLLTQQKAINVFHQKEKVYTPLLQSKDGQSLFTEDKIYSLPDLYELRSNCIPKNIKEVETIIDDNHLLCLPKGTGVALAIWNIAEKRWEYEFEGVEQSKLAVTSDEKYVFTTDSSGYVSMWRLPDNLKNDSIDVDFEITKRKLYVGDTVSFTNKTLPYALTNGYDWNFGNGTKTITKDAKKIYETAGRYTITLTVTLKNGTKQSKQKEIEVEHRPELLKEVTSIVRKGKVESIDISSDNNSLFYCIEKDSARLFNIINSEVKTIVTDNNPFYTVFSRNNDSLIVLCSSYPPPYDFYMRPLIGYFTGLVKESALSLHHSFLHREGRYINDINDIKNRPKLLYRHFRVGISEQKEWMAISSEVNYQHTGSGSYVFNLSRGALTEINDRTVLSVNDSAQSDSEPCISELRSPIRSISISPNNNTYVVATDHLETSSFSKCEPIKPHIQIVEKSTKKIIKKLNDNAYCVRYSPDNYHLVSTSGIWDIDSNKIIHEITTPFTTEFEILPDGDNIVLPYKNEQGAIAGIYSIRENKWRTFFYGSPSRGLIDVTALAISDDGKYVATGSSTGTVALWQIPDSLKPKPHAEFRIVKYKGTVGEPIRFYNTSIPVHNNFTYTWYFGDGSTSAEKNPTHVYENKGIYSTRLVMKDSVGTMYSYTHNTYVEIEVPSGICDENNKMTLTVYPNPCNESVGIVVPEYPCELTISDMSGTIVYRTIMQSESLNIESRFFPAGLYTVSIKGGTMNKSVHCLITAK